MSAVATREAAAVRLIERLVADSDFRTEFRRDPEAAARAAHLDGVDRALLDQLAALGPDALENLEGRESRSSLAGVMIAAAAEGVSLHELGESLANHTGPSASAPAPIEYAPAPQAPPPAAAGQVQQMPAIPEPAARGDPPVAAPPPAPADSGIGTTRPQSGHLPASIRLVVRTFSRRPHGQGNRM